MYLNEQPGGPKYFGTGAEVDAAWDELLWGRYFSISENEARQLWGDEYREYRDFIRGGYTGG